MIGHSAKDDLFTFHNFPSILPLTSFVSDVPLRFFLPVISLLHCTGHVAGQDPALHDYDPDTTPLLIISLRLIVNWNLLSTWFTLKPTAFMYLPRFRSRFIVSLWWNEIVLWSIPNVLLAWRSSTLGLSIGEIAVLGTSRASLFAPRPSVPSLWWHD